MSIANREEHLKKLAGLFDSPQLVDTQDQLRRDYGDCWDCDRDPKLEYLLLGGVRKVIITCRRLAESSNGVAIPTMRSLPFRCPNWKRKKKLTVIDGG